MYFNTSSDGQYGRQIYKIYIPLLSLNNMAVLVLLNTYETFDIVNIYTKTRDQTLPPHP